MERVRAVAAAVVVVSSSRTMVEILSMVFCLRQRFDCLLW